MTRDEALFIARRIMDRIELDQALHLDAIATEVMAGVAVIEADDDEPDDQPVFTVRELEMLLTGKR